MSKKQFKRTNKRTLNIFADGGNMAIGAVASTAGSVLNSQDTNKDDLSSAINGNSTTDPLKRMFGDLSGNSTKDAIAKIQSQNSNVTASNNIDLLKVWGNTQMQGNVSAQKFGIADNLGASAQGAAAGSSFGPWGILGGGILGGVANVTSFLGRNKRASQINDAINKANTDKVNNFNNAASNIDTQNDLNMLANYHAYGGKLLGEGGNLYEDIPNEGTHGGNFSNGVTLINAGGTHEENPLTGVPMGIAKDGQPNFVEQGEVKWGDYIFSNRTSPDKKMLKTANLPLGLSSKTFARIAEDMNKESSERPNDPISRNGIKSDMTKLQMLQEAFKQMNAPKENKEQGKTFAKGGRLNNVHYADNGLQLNMIDYANEQDLKKGSSLPFGDFNSINNIKRTSNDLFGIQSITRGVPSQTEGVQFPSSGMNELESKQALIPQNNLKGVNFNQNEPIQTPTLWDNIKGKASKLETSDLRYVPALAGAIGTIGDTLGWTNKPNRENADMLGNFANSLPEVSAKPIGNYMAYTPLDRDYYLNKLNAQAAGTRNAIINTSGGNRANAQANILAADYNAQNSIGNLGRQAEEYNLNQRQLVENFNRGTNQFNSEQDLKAAGINRGNDQLRLQAKMAQANIMEQENVRSAAGKSANLTNLFESLGGIGRESHDRNMIKDSNGLYYYNDAQGHKVYKSKEESEDIDKKKPTNSKAYGGKLSKKNSLNINI